MGMNLEQKRCIPCHGEGVQALGYDDAQRMLADVGGWSIATEGKTLSCAWQFKDYASSWAFVNQISELAEAEGHHPDITFGWGYVTVSLMTHSIGGLHENDFVLAAKINALGK